MFKKSLVVVAIVSAACMFMVGCNTPADAANTIEGMANQENNAQNALDAFHENADGKEEEADAILDSLNSGKDTELNNLSKGGYTFTNSGVAMTPDMDFAPVLATLGEPQHYYEVKSCAFEGMDKIYTYGSFEITTYPDGATDRISYINFKDDTVTTDEGVYLSMSKDKVIEIYGDSFVDDAGVIVYEKGGMELKFIFGGDSLKSVEYATEALKDKE